MNNEFLREIDRALAAEEAKRNDALSEQEIAADMKAEAVKKEREAKAVIRELNVAKAHVEKARVLREEKVENDAERINVVEKETVVVKEEKKKSGGFVAGLVVGATALAILAGSVKLYKESKTGDVKIAASNVNINDSVKDEPEDLTIINDEVKYNNEENVVIVEENKDDYELTENVKYEELSNENFENLVANYANKYSEQYTSVSTEDITKFAVVANIDLLCEENPELVSEVAGVKTREEFLNDAAKLIGATVMNNFNVWNATNSTEDFIRVSDIVYGEQKQQMIKIEEYVDRIAEAANMNDADLVNEIVSEFLIDMNSGDLSKLDDGVGFVAQVNIAMISDGIARNYLNQQNFDMFQVLKTSEKYVSNIFTEYDRCLGSGKTHTR